jgi:cell wall-associated NlpC family hydrolase
MDAWRDAVLQEAKGWLKTRWHHNARIKGAGVDCGQYVIAAYVGSGLVPDFATGEYPADWMMHRSEERYLEFVEAHLDRVAAPQPADVAVWKVGRCFAHGAIVVDWPIVLHAYRKERGVVYGDGTKGEFAGRPVRFYSIAGRL